ncbi:alpha/beta hydrolase family esterase [Leptospira sp. GIMC2001]|uniref:alpha/beta hydrolase family esterase n=1 Tax=Leptospira sp. GIMC2001 TaxID=1513297 RepID=UPI0023495857|nr:prolyl oligopeptidase family serine peptidase [Leptospira sp. GIMC2001]WCL49744.1 prolyl oligopeptidase family serine peptidase [Leptospira sp. GIMC2001]
MNRYVFSNPISLSEIFVRMVKITILLNLFLIFGCHHIRDYRISQRVNVLSKTIFSGGIKRSYHIYIPNSVIDTTQNSDLNQDNSIQKIQNTVNHNKYGLILFLHGRYGTGRQAMIQSDFNSVADKHKLIIIYPDGFDRSWADGRGGTPADRKGIDDVGFIEEIIKNSLVDYPIDESRIFISGHSNGGFMTQRMLLEKTELFRAGASVVSQLSENLLRKYRPSKPLSVLFINGTEDPLVPYYGGYVSDNGLILSAEESFDRWVQWNGCIGKGSISKQNSNLSDKTSLVYNLHNNCDNNTSVGIIKIIGGGHSWPGKMDEIPFIDLGNPTYEINGADTIWNFFESI